jgi:hypothetical protein
MVTVDPDANPLDDPGDAAALARHAAALVDAVDAALVAWVQRMVEDRWRRANGGAPITDELRARARAVGERARGQLVPQLRSLVATDVDEQRTNPLALLRRAVPAVTEVLEAAGVPPVARDAEAERLFPDDVYDLTPGAFADLDPSVHEPGLVWGAAKAHVILARRRREGRR